MIMWGSRKDAAAMKTLMINGLVFGILVLGVRHSLASDSISANDLVQAAEKDGKVTTEELKTIATLGPQVSRTISSRATTDNLREFAKKADDLLATETKRSKVAIDYFADYSAELYLAQALDHPSLAVRLYVLPIITNCVSDLSLGKLLSAYDRLSQEQVTLDGGEQNAAARDIERGLLNMLQTIMGKHGVKARNTADLLRAAREWWKDNGDKVQSQANADALRRISTHAGSP